MRILFILFFSILFVSCSSDNKSERKQINEILAKGEKITNYENLSLEDSKEVSQKNSIKFSKFKKYKIGPTSTIITLVILVLEILI